MKALAHPMRMRILALLREGGLCVCQITEVLGIPTSTALEHLTEPRRAGVLTERKAGRWVHYGIGENPRTEGLAGIVAPCGSDGADGAGPEGGRTRPPGLPGHHLRQGRSDRGQVPHRKGGPPCPLDPSARHLLQPCFDARPLLVKGNHAGEAVAFFRYDAPKVLTLMVFLVTFPQTLTSNWPSRWPWPPSASPTGRSSRPLSASLVTGGPRPPVGLSYPSCISARSQDRSCAVISEILRLSCLRVYGLVSSSTLGWASMSSRAA